MTSTSADSVSVISRHTVRCANEASWTELNSPFSFGPLDQMVLPFIPVAVIFVYEQPTSTPDVEVIPVKRLQRALTLLLDYYPHLTGRLHINPSDGNHEITRLGSGAEILEARCSERLDAFSPGSHSPGRISMQKLPAAGNALFAPFDGTPEGVGCDPIFTIQHTRFACGGVSLGVRLTHTTCDADGFFQLVHDLAELYRGLNSIEKNGSSTSEPGPSLANPPHIRSYMSELMNGRNLTPEERNAALEFKPSLFYVDPSAGATDASNVTETASNVTEIASNVTETASFPPSPSPIEGRILRFSSRELDALKAHATDPNGGPSSSGSWISTFDALSAHLYQCVHRARLQLRSKDAKQCELSSPDFLTPVNVRKRLGPEFLPLRYFPNATLAVYTTLPLDLLADGPLWQVAKALHALTHRPSTTSKEEMNRTLRWIAVQPDKREFKQQGFQYGSGSFMVSQWNKFDMYSGSVFEVRPILVSTPFTPISLLDGLVYFLPTEDQGTGRDAGAIDVNMSLSEPLWGLIDQDDEFRRFREA